MENNNAYLEAEKRIETTQRSGATSLSLYDLRLTELPRSLRQLTQLNSLDIGRNQLIALPDWLRHFTQLRSLDIESNKLTTLPEWLGKLNLLQSLNLFNNQLTVLPESLGELTQLESLNLFSNLLTTLPESLGKLTKLKKLTLYENKLTALPDSIGSLKNLQLLNLFDNCLTKLPESLGQLIELQELNLQNNYLTDIPSSLLGLLNFVKIIDYSIKNNPLNPELAAAYAHGLGSIKAYLRAKAAAQITLYEAKLILVGEGEVGKTCLMDALLGNPWQEHDTTHGIQIKSIKTDDPITKKEITLNGWDFGGQRVYRPTHQLFFSAPAVYLVVWKPREGPQQGFVKEWIKLIKHREPSAKIIVVATHGGPQQRQPDIDRQELWDLFGKETIVDFFFVDSKPDERGNRKNIEELKLAIASVAATLPEVGRSVPKSFQDVRLALEAKGAPYLPLAEVLAICRAHKMDDEIAHLFITISHRLGHLTHYENDPTLRDIVILRPDWLATAMSYVLDDEQTRHAHGLVKFSRLSQLWDDPSRTADSRYPAALHPIFLRLMERFDLSYRVADPASKDTSDPLSLIAQLVPDSRPENIKAAWQAIPSAGDIQQTQICRIVDAQNGQSASAEGLFYQLIVRLHRYSLGRLDYNNSVHWQRGLILDNAYNGRAFLEHKGNDVYIAVHAPYPERFLAMLTEEVKYLVESFWEGLCCDVTVPCLNPNGCLGLFEVEKLIENKRRGRPEQPCPICNEWQSIDSLLLNAPAASQPISLIDLQKEFATIKDKLDEVSTNTNSILSRVDKTYTDLLQVFTDEAKEGPRLFSLFPKDRSNFNPKGWIRAQFRLVLWCEHSRLPLPALNGKDSKKGIYDLELDREWFKNAAPYLKLVTSTLSLVLPVASSTFKMIDSNTFQALENQLDLSKNIIDAVTEENTDINEFMGAADTTNLERGVAIRADGATLRELHALLKAKDPSFGDLVRVINKHQEFLWVHPMFKKEY